MTTSDHNTIVKAMRTILDCKNDIRDFGLYMADTPGALKHYINCMNSKIDYNHLYHTCLRFSPKFCHTRHDFTNMEKCDTFKTIAFNNAINQTISNTSTEHWDKDLPPFMLEEDENIDRLNAYTKCMAAALRQHMKCFPPLQRRCEDSKLRVIKLIRSNYDLTMDIIKSHDPSYVIHQIRDPRGILLSRKKAKLLTYDIQTEAKMLCDTMLRNLKAFRQLARTNPEKVLLVTYEDLAKDAFAITKNIYSFLKTSLPEDMNEFLMKIMYGNEKMEFTFSHSRRNGTATSIAWRHMISETEKEIIDKGCKEFLLYSGYEI